MRRHGRLTAMLLGRVPMLLVVLLASAACTASPAPTSTPGPTSPSGPTATPSPMPTPTPSTSPAGRVFTQADFTRSGGCGDVFMYVASADDTTAIVIEWSNAATQAVEDREFHVTVTLPDPRVTVSLQVGRLLAAGYCTDIGEPNRQVDGNAAAVSGTVELTVRPNGDQLFDTANADVTLRDIVLDVIQGTEVEHWRLDQLELEDILVGWLAG